MRMFTLDEQGTLVPYIEKAFGESNTEADLEDILENNPGYFFEDHKILIIGRQVSTNFNTYIDLLGINAAGNTVVVELKRGRTPRETIAQLLEYASFIESLDYEQLNLLFKEYSGEESELEDYVEEYFIESKEENISWNKNSILLIVGQSISNEIKQTALYLRKRGIDVRCAEFKYFLADNKKIFTCDYIIGSEDIVKSKVQTASLQKVDKDAFLNSADKYGKYVFETVLNYAGKNGLLVRWGSKGFSLNYKDDTNFVALLFGFPPHSAWKQSIYTGYDEINKKIIESEKINEYYKTEVKKLGVFQNAQKSEKWIINKEHPKEIIENYLKIIDEVIKKLKESNWKNKADS